MSDRVARRERTGRSAPRRGAVRAEVGPPPGVGPRAGAVPLAGVGRPTPPPGTTEGLLLPDGDLSEVAGDLRSTQPRRPSSFPSSATPPAADALSGLCPRRRGGLTTVRPPRRRGP